MQSPKFKTQMPKMEISKHSLLLILSPEHFVELN